MVAVMYLASRVQYDGYGDEAKSLILCSKSPGLGVRITLVLAKFFRGPVVSSHQSSFYPQDELEIVRFGWILMRKNRVVLKD